MALYPSTPSLFKLICFLLLSVVVPTRASLLRGLRQLNENTFIEQEQQVLVLSSEFILQKVNVTKELCSVVTMQHRGPILDQVQQQREIYERFDAFTDGFNDQALIAKTRDGICFATFQATVNNLSNGLRYSFHYLADTWQNMNPFTEKIADDCRVRRGWVAAFRGNYEQEFSDKLDDCVASCDGGCPLVLGGESAGGAAAVIASVIYSHHNPQVITFGAPKAIKLGSSCSQLNATQHYRFINTLDGAYDSVATQINIFSERHVGWPIYLDGDNQMMSTTLGETLPRQPRKRALHDWSLYTARVEAIAGRLTARESLRIQKWPAGHYCNFDDECASGRCDETDSTSGGCT